MREEILLKKLFSVYIFTRFLHWNIHDFSVHLISDELVDELHNLIDELGEIFLAEKDGILDIPTKIPLDRWDMFDSCVEAYRNYLGEIRELSIHFSNRTTVADVITRIELAIEKFIYKLKLIET